jgi:hypothetical protein
VIAPHAYSSHSKRSARSGAFEGLELSDESHCNSAAVGIFAKTSPSLVNPDGGHFSPKHTTGCNGGSFFFFFFFFFVTFFFASGFLVSLMETSEPVFWLGFGVGFGVEVAAYAEVTERVRAEITNAAINFLNLDSI